MNKYYKIIFHSIFGIFISFQISYGQEAQTINLNIALTSNNYVEEATKTITLSPGFSYKGTTGNAFVAVIGTVIPNGLTSSDCQGDANQYTISSVNNATSYLWTISNPIDGTISGSSTTGTFTPNSNFTGQVEIGVSAINAGGGVITAEAITLLQSIPAITTEPVSLSQCEGTSATFTVTATGSNLTYQWQKYVSGNMD